MPPILPVVLGFLVAAAAVPLVWRPWRGAAAPKEAPLATALAFAAAALAAQLALAWPPSWPPRESWQRLAYLALLAVPLAALEGGGGARRASLWVARAVLAAAFLLMTSVPLREYHWEGAEAWSWLGGAFAVFLLMYAMFERLARARAEGPGLPLVLLVAFSGTAVALGLSGSVTLALFAGAVCPVLGALVTVGLWRRDAATLKGATGTMAATLVGLVWIGVQYSGTSLPAAGVALASPLAAALPGRRGWRAVALRVAVASALAGVAVWLSWPEPDPYGDYY